MSDRSTRKAPCRPANLNHFAWLARLPGALPWRLAPYCGTDPLLDIASVAEGFRKLFPHVDAHTRQQWLVRHCTMRSHELVDAHAFSRLVAQHGITWEVQEWPKVGDSSRGTLLVLTHLDRFLTAPLALTTRGVRLSMLTMAPDALPFDAYRTFLNKKIAAFHRLIGGAWRTTRQPLTAMMKGLRQGEWWIALPDAWEPAFRDFRFFPFLGGTIAFPAGLIRIAEKTGCRILYGETVTVAPNHLRILFTPCPEPAAQAFAWIAERLANAVAETPWRWWQWPLLPQLYQSAPQDFMT
ncbi:MAG: hypothetical protein ACK4JZ_06465 [Hydrogenophilus thermoluteolus]